MHWSYSVQHQCRFFETQCRKKICGKKTKNRARRMCFDFESWTSLVRYEQIKRRAEDRDIWTMNGDETSTSYIRRWHLMMTKQSVHAVISRSVVFSDLVEHTQASFDVHVGSITLKIVDSAVCTTEGVQTVVFDEQLSLTTWKYQMKLTTSLNLCERQQTARHWLEQTSGNYFAPLGLRSN